MKDLQHVDVLCDAPGQSWRSSIDNKLYAQDLSSLSTSQKIVQIVGSKAPIFSMGVEISTRWKSDEQGTYLCITNTYRTTYRFKGRFHFVPSLESHRRE